MRIKIMYANQMTMRQIQDLAVEHNCYPDEVENIKGITLTRNQAGEITDIMDTTCLY